MPKLHLILVLVVCTLFGGCVYPRHTTPLHPAGSATVDMNVPQHLWTLRVVGADVPSRKPMGLKWDSDGSKPDPFVRIYLDGRKLWESEPAENNLRPEWDYTLPRNVYIGPKTKLRVELWDRDRGVSNDTIGHFEQLGRPNTLQPGAPGRVNLTNGASVTLELSAPKGHRGIGIQRYERRHCALHVLDVENHSPAQRAGIRPGDRIIAINGDSIGSLEPTEATTRLTMAAEYGYPIELLDEADQRREVQLDKGYVWLVM